MGVAINEAPKAAINCWRPPYCVRASQNCAHINGHSSFQRAGDRSTIAQRLKTSSNALKDVKNTLYQLQSSTRAAEASEHRTGSGRPNRLAA
jgi:hypothetical protein